VLRHTAFFLLRPDSGPAEQLNMLKGLAHMRFNCPSVSALDCGEDIFGGSSRLREVKPFTRTPRWRGAVEGPPSNYDVALMLDFVDQDALKRYDDDPVHHEVGDYNASVGDPELTARVDWEYDGEPLIRRGHVRHSEMFVWRDDTPEEVREEAIARLRGLESERGVESLHVARNVGPLTTDYDLILDVQVPDRDTAAALLEGEAYAETMRAIAPVTKYEWTARLTHVMRGM
jgi:hypothetical protein